MKSIGQTIRTARVKNELSPEAVAKRLKISAAYLGHLERDSHVTLSPRVVEGLVKALKVKLPKRAVEAHNEASRKWYSNYRKARAKAAKKAA